MPTLLAKGVLNTFPSSLAWCFLHICGYFFEIYLTLKEGK